MKFLDKIIIYSKSRYKGLFLSKDTQKYPIDFRDKDLKDKILEYADHPLEQNNLTIAKYTKAMVGLIELQGRDNKRVSAITLSVSIVALAVSIYGLRLSLIQTQYAEIQSTEDRINQARSINAALARCDESPQLTDSGLFEIQSGKSATCSQVIKFYKN